MWVESGSPGLVAGTFSHWDISSAMLTFLFKSICFLPETGSCTLPSASWVFGEQVCTHMPDPHPYLYCTWQTVRQFITICFIRTRKIVTLSGSYARLRTGSPGALGSPYYYCLALIPWAPEFAGLVGWSPSTPVLQSTLQSTVRFYEQGIWTRKLLNFFLFFCFFILFPQF